MKSKYTYDVVTYRLQRCLTAPNFPGFSDMTSCEHYHCQYMYTGDHVVVCVLCTLTIVVLYSMSLLIINRGGFSANAAHIVTVIATCAFLPVPKISKSLVYTVIYWGNMVSS